MTVDAGHGVWRYRPITHEAGQPWPGGRGLAVYIAIGIEDYRFGVGRTESIVDDVDGHDLVNTSWRDYGNRVGGFRLLDRLRRMGIAPTILLNTEVYDTAPDLIDVARRDGAEFVGHGLSNSDVLTDLDPDAEAAYVKQVADRIAAEEGSPPGGWSSPWLSHTPATLDCLVGAGYDYLLDLRIDDRPVELDTGQGQLLSLPYALELNDSTTMVGRGVGPRDFAAMIIDEFDELLAAAENQPLVMSIVLHSFISGAPFRLRALDEAFNHLAAHADKVWFTQPRHIVDHVRGRSR